MHALMWFWIALVSLVGLPDTLTPVHGPQRIERASVFDAPTLIENKLIYPTGPGQTCIAVLGPTSESSVVSAAIIKNVTCAPGNGFSWLTCVDLTNGWLSHLDTINCIGPSGLPSPVTTNGFILRGQSTDVSLTHLRCSGVWTCIYITDESEGPRITDLSAVGAVYGIVVTTPGIEPALTIAHVHLNVTHVGIWLKNRREWVMDDVLIYADNYFTADWPFYAVSLDNSPVGELRNVRVSKIHKTAPFFPLNAVASDRVRGDVERIVW
jgi:hypothetical protein